MTGSLRELIVEFANSAERAKYFAESYDDDVAAGRGGGEAAERRRRQAVEHLADARRVAKRIDAELGDAA